LLIAGQLAVLGCVIGLLVLLAVWIRSQWPEARELSRKVIHIGCGLLLPLSWSLGLPKLLALGAAVCATAIICINHRTHWFALIEDVERKTYGTIFYCVSICCLIFFFWSSCPGAMLAGALVMAISDGLASLIGRFVPSPKWHLYGQTKSLAGTSAMLLSTLGIISIVQLALGPGLSTTQILTISIIITGLEQLSGYGIDNLSVPVATASIVSFISAWPKAT
jgi:phytol kinase